MAAADDVRERFLALSEVEQDRALQLFRDWERESASEGFDAVSAFAAAIADLCEGHRTGR